LFVHKFSAFTTLLLNYHEDVSIVCE